MADTRLKAITIGVRHHHGLAALDFAAELVTQVATALRKVDYEVTEIAADTLDAEQLGARIQAALKACTADDLLIVHVLSHGELGDGDSTVYVLGSDGIKNPVLDVDQWLKNLQLGGPRTLFLLDLCCAGTAARLPWQQRLDSERTRGWVVAACQRDQAAYDGRFSQALVAVLNGLRDNEFDVDPTVSHVPLTTIARALRQEVNRLTVEADSYGQTVTASLQDISSDPDLPFFRNFGHADNEHTRMRTGLHPALRPFLDELDEGLDARHFLDRAAGVGRLTDQLPGQLIGCFSGRKAQLIELSGWMDRPEVGGLCVVIGSPGVGKSALLGIMVCAGHKVLRRPTRPIWNEVERAPYQVDRLAAVHARQRRVPAIVRVH
ncbi:caspase family protein [Kutzneria sp. 744]|uniref:caspase family protein n=1 Tax=Kutzneria sp. (strain 744) TaxID=345341 RepID=UPI0004B46AE9|nr:caspase family protein [Kutzneria sp. 744]